MSDPILLLIRPHAQSTDFLAALSTAIGHTPITLHNPLVDVNMLSMDDPLTNAQFLLFSSVNGVKYFAAQTENRAVPALCVGNTTAQSARSHGFQVISADGNAQDLLHLALKTADRDKGMLYYVSGKHSAFDFAAALTDHGYVAKRVIVYAQTALKLTAESRQTLQTRKTIVPIFSPRAAKTFASECRNLNLGSAHLVCISHAVADPLRQLSAQITVAAAPTRAGMIAALSPLI